MSTSHAAPRSTESSATPPASSAPSTDSGVHFPTDASGSRSTGTVARAVVADGLAVVDGALADRARHTREWRKNYLGPFTDLVAAGADDGTTWDRIARSSLDSLQSRMVAVHDDSEIPMTDYLASARPRHSFETETLSGSGRPVEELVIPYKGTQLRGDALRSQLEDWVSRGIIEPSCATALTTVQEHPEWLSLPGRAALVLGLGSEMGPAKALLEWGATVAGVDLPGSPVWERMRAWVPTTAGTLHAPSAEGQPGADLLGQLPELAAWARSVTDHPLTLGTYAYADGGKHVRVSSAADALAAHLLDDGAVDALAYLATPMDTFVVPPDVRAESNERYAARQGRLDIRTIAGTLTRHSLFDRNYARGDGPGIHDALVPQQGPNYTLAKRVQRWRATTAFTDGHTVSITVAPSTNTRSVTKNKALAFAYKGAPVFDIEILEPETSSTMLAALLVHDLYADVPRPDIQWQEESRAAASGGLWRQPYKPRSALTIAAAIGTVKR